MLPSIEQRLAAEIAAKPAQIAAAIALLDEGATVPFISRYRKEATGGLDDTQLRLLEDRLRYLRELEERREAIIASITEQGKMTPELLKAVSLATDKTHLEDLYLPYKPKRRTKAQIALEAGLEPLRMRPRRPSSARTSDTTAPRRYPGCRPGSRAARRRGTAGRSQTRRSDKQGRIPQRKEPSSLLTTARGPAPPGPRLGAERLANGTPTRLRCERSLVLVRGRIRTCRDGLLAGVCLNRSLPASPGRLIKPSPVEIRDSRAGLRARCRHVAQGRPRRCSVGTNASFGDGRSPATLRSTARSRPHSRHDTGTGAARQSAR